MSNGVFIPIVDANVIQKRIYIIRGRKVMLDKDLAVLYGVPTMRLNQAVRRNLKRFPPDFMFVLTKEETSNWISQNAISNSRSQNVILKKQGTNIKYLPLVFTEQGIAMLSSVLKSDRAIDVNIQIIRVFTKLREMVMMYKELREKVEEMEKNNDVNFKKVFQAIRLLITEEEKPKSKMGFDTGSN